MVSECFSDLLVKHRVLKVILDRAFLTLSSVIKEALVPPCIAGDFLPLFVSVWRFDCRFPAERLHFPSISRHSLNLLL